MGDMIVVRYADDLAVGFEHEGDARRFLDAMRERLDVGHVFQQEVGHRFRFEAGRGSDLMSATWRLLPVAASGSKLRSSVRRPYMQSTGRNGAQ